MHGDFPLLLDQGQQLSYSETITKAKKAGADAIKLQTYNAKDMTLNIDEREFLIKKKNFKSKLWNNRSLYSLYDEASLPEKFYPTVVQVQGAEVWGYIPTAGCYGRSDREGYKFQITEVDN